MLNIRFGIVRNVRRIEIDSEVEGDKSALEFTASIASAYRLSTSKAKLSEQNSGIPGLDRLVNTTG
jgi:hypothetical protein